MNCNLVSRIFVASPRGVQKREFLGGCLILDNTPSTASIIPEDAGDAMHAGDAKQSRQRGENAGKQESLEVNEMEATGIARK